MPPIVPPNDFASGEGNAWLVVGVGFPLSHPPSTSAGLSARGDLNSIMQQLLHATSKAGRKSGEALRAELSIKVDEGL